MPGAKDILKNILTNGTSKLIEKIGEAGDRLFTNKEELLKAKAEFEKIGLEHAEEMAKIALEDKKLDVELEKEITARMQSEDSAITARWASDMASDSWLSKNTRPLVMVALLGFLFVIIILDSCNIPFEVKPGYVTLMESLLITVVVAYFGSRGVEKFKAMHETTKITTKK